MSTPKNIVNILFLGIDKKEGNLAKTDTVLLFTANLETNNLSCLFIPRDTRVAIKNGGYDKINHAFAFGKEPLTLDTVQNLLDIEIDHYIRLDMDTFKKIIDTLGGVEVDVEHDMHYEDPYDEEGLKIDLKRGRKTLLGKDTLDYLRYQDARGDLGRIERQKEFVPIFLNQFRQKDVFTILTTIFTTQDQLQTDMSIRESIAFIRFLFNVETDAIQTDILKGKHAIFEKVNYYLPFILENRTNFFEKIHVNIDDEQKTRWQEDEKHYIFDLPKSIYEDKKGTDKKVKLAEKTAQKIVHQLVAEEPNDQKQNITTQESQAESQKTIVREEKTFPKTEEQLAEDRLKISRASISVTVINSSGINGAGKEVATILKDLGYNVTEVRTGEYSDRLKTTITTPTEQIDGFYGMPFSCILMDGGELGKAVVNIGKDYQHE